MAQKKYALLTSGVITVVFVTLIGLHPAQAEEYPVAGFEKLVLVVPHAQVNVSAGNSSTVKVQGSAGSWSARQEGTTLRLVGGLGVNSGGRTPLSKVDIVIPPMAVELHVQEGQINIQKWTKPVLVDLQKGRLLLKENQARAVVSVGQGNVIVQAGQGPLSIDGYKADVSIENQNGNVEASFFSGEVKIDKSSGLFNIDIYQGGVKVSKSSGTLTVDSAKASTQVTEFKGRIEGFSVEGALQVDALPDAEVHLKSEQGRITVVSKQSGSYLVARSVDGDIQPPRTMRVGRDKTSRVVRGRLKGPSSNGRVELHSQKNMIVVRD